MKLLHLLAIGCFALLGAPSLTFAQHLDYHNGHYHLHRNVPHGHDAAGHLVDRAGHHIDGHGNHTPYGVYENGAVSRGYYSGYSGLGYSSSFDGGLYGTYGGYQPLAVRPYGSSAYANPSYMSPSYNLPPNFSLDSGTYSLGAMRNLSSPSLAPPNRAPFSASRQPLSSSSTTWPSRGEIKILHPADAVDDVNYALNGSTYSIKPGYAQKFADDRNWTIAFGSGGTKGDLRYTLKAGTYRFVATDDGWDIKQIKETTKPADGDIPPPLPSPE